MPDTTVLSCFVWRYELSSPECQTGEFCVWRCSATTKMHSDAERTCPAVKFTPPDKTRPASRPLLPQRRPGRQLCLATRLPMQRRCMPRKCKYTVDCCMWLNLNLFTKHRVTRAIYRLTVQTLSDGLETIHTTWHDRLVLCGGRCELGMNLALLTGTVPKHDVTVECHNDPIM